jgi:hypothetical protein
MEPLLVQYVPDALQFPGHGNECHDQEDNAHDQQGIDHDCSVSARYCG